MCVFIGNIFVDFLLLKNGRSAVYSVVNFPENCIGCVGLHVYTYANLTCVYLKFIWTCVVVIVIIVDCLCLFLSMCLFVLVNFMLNAFAICVGELTVLSLELFYCCCNEVCDTLVGVCVLLIISEIN